ncbi:hypothetical protein F53441_7138 [Fusarium austroafricanum]|uniref:Uncharacterized protein n=1 Tax=Fusarium austroafricanum TaxID=2364996 RepID=A0A8H4KE68_9HYPO|nr:hypothetical protein F53441_7138 [Fusarium austroafricanum]
MRNKKFDVNNPGMGVHEISLTYQVVFGFIRDSCSHNCRNKPDAPDPSLCSDLARSWACKNWGYDFDMKDCASQIENNELYKADLLTAVVSSAVIQRVFEPAFPDFLYTASPLANSYRQIIVNMFGLEELHRADYNTLCQITEKQRPEIIDRKVKELDDLLLQHLEFLWAPPTHGPEGDDSMLAEPPRTNFSFKFCLKKALKFKLDLAITTTRLKFSYYRPNEPFDESRMERTIGSDYKQDRIKFCLFPTLLFPPDRELTTTSNDYVLEFNTRVISHRLIDVGVQVKDISALLAVGEARVSNAHI